MGEPITRRQFVEGLVAVALGVSLAPKQAFASVDEITQEEITRYMGMSTVEDILGDSVRYIKPGEWDGAVAGSKKEGVLILAYNGSEASKRNAVAFKKLIENYGGKIDFFATFVNQQVEKYKVLTAPSIILASKKDALNKKQGEMSFLDIMRGGADANKYINPLFIGMRDYWVRGNVFALPNPDDNKIYRYENTYKLHVVGEIAASK